MEALITLYGCLIIPPDFRWAAINFQEAKRNERLCQPVPIKIICQKVTG